MTQTSIGPGSRVQGRTADYQLGPAVGSGGEGTVYRVLGRPERVIKIYSTPLDADGVDKLKVVVAKAQPSLAAFAS